MDEPPTPLRRNFDFIRLLLAQGLSISGREIGAIVLPLLVLATTGSPTHVGFIAAAQAIPYLLLSLPAGALVDRWDRRRVMLICEYVRVLALLSLPVVWLIHDLFLIHLYVVAVTTGVAFVFYSIAEIAALPQLVASPSPSPSLCWPATSYRQHRKSSERCFPWQAWWDLSPPLPRPGFSARSAPAR